MWATPPAAGASSLVHKPPGRSLNSNSTDSVGSFVPAPSRASPMSYAVSGLSGASPGNPLLASFGSGRPPPAGAAPARGPLALLGEQASALDFTLRCGSPPPAAVPSGSLGTSTCQVPLEPPPSALSPLPLQRLSHVPPGSEVVVAGERVVMPGQPASLTVGMVSPEAVQAQKEEYARNLDEQQRQGREVLNQQTQRQRDYIRMQAEQQKAIAAGRWDQQLRAQEMAAEQEYQFQLAKLREAASQLKTVLESQATQLLMEYNARKAQEELSHKTYEAELRAWEDSRHWSAERARNAEGRLHGQLALAVRQNTAARRVAGGLPELPVDRWVPGSGREEPTGPPTAGGALAAHFAGQSPYPLAPAAGPGATAQPAHSSVVY